jgi:hypothetical protein
MPLHGWPYDVHTYARAQPAAGGAGGILVGHDGRHGNGWVLQEVRTRFAGRVAGDTTYASVNDLAQALRRAEAAHCQHEKRTGQRDENWPAWYAENMVREQSGDELPL